MKNKFAFTLAEVLITLVIIGVVAALTISAVINTYVERSTISKVKKGLSTIAQAKKLAEAQNGSIEGWDFAGNWTAESANKFWKYLKSHISLAKDCGTGDESCYQSNGVYQLNGQEHSTNYNTSNQYYKFILSDGGVMWFRAGGTCLPSGGSWATNYCAVFYYDVNGTKSPNTIGKDIFVYLVYSDGVYPRFNLDNECNINRGGISCSDYIIQNDNMNYLH